MVVMRTIRWTLPAIGLATAPLRVAATGTRMALNAAAGAAAVAGGAALVDGSAVSGIRQRIDGVTTDLGTITRAAAGVAIEALGGEPLRRASSHGDRRWIEIRGLDGPDAARIADDVLSAVRAMPGVRRAALNRPIARVVVTVAADGPSTSEIGKVVAEAERAGPATGDPAASTNLPGDDAVLVARTAAAAFAAAGFGLALTGSVLRIRGLPDIFSAPPTLADHIPQLRRQIEQRLGSDGTDLLFATLNSAAAALTVSPASAAAEAATRAMLAAEAWNGRLAWRRHEPELAEHCADDRPAVTARQPAKGSADRYADRAGAVGMGAGAVLGTLSRSPDTAGAAALVASPKPIRATREAFACALGRGLTARHGALVMRPHVLRTLDRVDTVVIDPRVLYTDELMVSRVRGLSNSRRNKAWAAARAALEDGKLDPGWHRMSSIRGAGRTGEALISPVRDPYAAAVVAEARRARPRVVSLADDGLRSLAQGFDHLHPIGDSTDDALAHAVAAAKADGATVALLTTADMTAAHTADLTIGVLREQRRPPWGADVFVADLTGAWRMLHALPAARAASDRGVRLSMSSSAIGALMLIPSVVGRGPASMNVGAAAGLVSGFAAGDRVLRDPVPEPEPGHDWHALPVDEVRRLLPHPTEDDAKTSGPRTAGLLGAAAPLRSAAVGSWGLARDFVGEMRANLADPITPILATGAVASALLGSPFDAFLVSGVLLANAALSAEQQLHAERVLRRLLAVQDPPARRRVGPPEERRDEEVAAKRLRPGDVIEVRSGEVVPADARLIEAVGVEVDESSLTGESLPVAKSIDPTPGAPLAERACMLYSGTTMVAGTGLGVVTAVGSASEMRRAMAMTPGKSREIGLQSQLRRITDRALPWSVGGGALVGLLSLLRRTPLRESAGTAVGVIVAAVPEGLPLVATLAQLAAARKLSGESVLIRNPHSVEALARLRVVCFDKTGTLSENRLQVKSVRALKGFADSDVLRTAANTVLHRNGQRADHATDDAIRRAIGDFEETDHDAFLPFQSGRPFAASLDGTRLTIKGAPEVISSALTGANRQLSRMLDEMTADGLRVLAVAERELGANDAKKAAADAETMEKLCQSGLTPVGLVGLADTPRPSARALLKELGNRDIGVRLITGDHPVTATVIANDLGLDATPERVITGSEWEELSADQRAEAVTNRLVFARMSPEHKIDVVQTLERIDQVTAMVGDGANDAAAIRAASVGIGVAAEGSDPARTAADVMLLDGRIEALIDAIDEGHHLWRRVQSAVSVLLGGNAGEVCFALISSVLTGRSVLNARQMLLVNMLTDALPAAALAVSPQTETGEADRNEAAMWRAIAIRGAATTAGATMAWLPARATGTRRRASTVALIGLVSTQMLQTLADSHGPLVVTTTLGTFAAMAAVISTPGLSQLFGCTPVGPVGWGQACLAAGAASAVSALAPRLLAGVLPTTGSVVDDDDNPGADQDRVEVAQRRGQHPDGAAEQRVLSETAEQVPHDSAR